MFVQPVTLRACVIPRSNVSRSPHADMELGGARGRMRQQLNGVTGFKGALFIDEEEVMELVEHTFRLQFLKGVHGLRAPQHAASA